MSEYVVEIDDLSVTLVGEQFGENINIKLAKEDFLIIFGEDNSGKTTLLNAIMGFVKINTGEVHIFGKSIKELSMNERQKIRFVPDNVIMESEMTAQEYLSLMSMGNADYDFELEERLCESFQVNKSEALLNMTYQENKLVAMIAAMSARPQLLILDEPYNFLEKVKMKEILQELEVLNTQGTSILLTVEKYEHAMEYGGRYLYMDEGKIKQQGEIVSTELRSKAVSVPIQHNQEVGELLGEILGKHKNTVTYRYTGEMQKLLKILQELKCDNFSVEDITLKEELDEDYSRWE